MGRLNRMDRTVYRTRKLALPDSVAVIPLELVHRWIQSQVAVEPLRVFWVIPARRASMCICIRSIRIL